MKHNYHRIGWWENLQESPIFDGKNPWVSCRFSLKPIHDEDGLFQCQPWEVELADELRRPHPKTMSFAILN